jgi:hypothetical protein
MMDNQEKIAIMATTANQLVTMIQARVKTRMDTLTALSAVSENPIDNSPVEVKQMREMEASKIRAVMQEQHDLIAIIKMLFPGT